MIKKFKFFCKNILTTEEVCNIKRVTGREVGLQDRKVLCGAKSSKVIRQVNKNYKEDMQTVYYNIKSVYIEIKEPRRFFMSNE